MHIRGRLAPGPSAMRVGRILVGGDATGPQPKGVETPG